MNRLLLRARLTTARFTTTRLSAVGSTTTRLSAADLNAVGSIRFCAAGLSLVLIWSLILTCAPGVQPRAHAQAVDSWTRHDEKPSPVTYLYPEQITVPANKATTVELNFRIREGLHINSHTPHTAELIPTVLSLPDDSAVKLERAIYPSGTEFTLPVDPGHTLNVYSGDFSIRARLIAPVGDHLVEGRLRFQACNLSACMPPRTIPVAIEVKATRRP